MAHFYGTVNGNRGEASRLGGKESGLTTYAASWKGAIRTVLYVDESGRDCFRVEQTTHQGAGVYQVIAEGVLGEKLPARIDGLSMAEA